MKADFEMLPPELVGVESTISMDLKRGAEAPALPWPKLRNSAFLCSAHIVAPKPFENSESFWSALALGAKKTKVSESSLTSSEKAMKVTGRSLNRSLDADRTGCMIFPGFETRSC